MARTLNLMQDDLFFASRVQAHARRLGLQVEIVSPRDVEARAFTPDSVVVIQLTIQPERQFALLERLRSRYPDLAVIAVSGHLETELRRRAKRLGAVLATNSALDRTLASVCGIQAPTAP